ncbi:MAG TPA: prolyl oligopeptidase family serine peptidase [Verrucomicrobiales bacterium]|nr:prolyl oligopeptidase family serine peptidase [Verrucomicrobiales bacterium]
MRRSSIAFSLGMALNPISTAAAPPPTDSSPLRETLHGVEIADPYRWLEGSAAPELTEPDDALDARVAEWTGLQNAYTRAFLDEVPGRKALLTRLQGLFEVDSIGLPIRRGALLFNAERRGTQNQPVLYLRDGLDASPRALLDVNLLDPEGLTTLAWHAPSPDGSLVAFGMYHSGDENAILHLMESATGEWLADEIPGKVTGVHWLPDGAGFIYRKLADLKNPYSGQIRFHRVGRHHSRDPIVFEQYKEGPLATTWGPYAYTNRAARWLVLHYATSTKSNDLWVYDFKHWLESGDLRRIDLTVGRDASFDAFIRGDTLYILTTFQAPRGRVLEVDLAHPDFSNWREIIPEHPTAVIESLDQTRDELVVAYLDRAYTRIERFSFGGERLGELELPGIGSASVAADEERDDLFLGFESFNSPDSIYHCNLAEGTRSLWARPEVPVDPSLIAVRQEKCTSRDGTQVPFFVIQHKDLEADGSTPTLLFGYGGFNIPQTPVFRGFIIPWLEAGGVYVVANLRGGGEFGDDWRRDGMLERKQNVFDDFIAIAEWLQSSGITDRDHLAIVGGSNGGLLTGAVIVQRPELFRAAVSAVPLLDMIRYQHFLMARYWVPEYGTSEDSAQLPFLLAYSPYHQVKDDVRYPALFLTAGENDARVHPLHARKMAARMQALPTADPAARPVLLWVEGKTGHGAGTPLDLRIARTADQLLFLASQVGLRFDQDSASGN